MHSSQKFSPPYRSTRRRTPPAHPPPAPLQATTLPRSPPQSAKSSPQTKSEKECPAPTHRSQTSAQPTAPLAARSNPVVPDPAAPATAIDRPGKPTASAVELSTPRSYMRAGPSAVSACRNLRLGREQLGQIRELQQLLDPWRQIDNRQRAIALMERRHLESHQRSQPEAE